MKFFETSLGIFTKYSVLFFNGVKITLLLAITGTVFGLVIGLIVGAIRAITLEERSSKLAKAGKKVLDYILTVYIEFFRGTPMMVQSFFMYYGLKSAGVNWTPIVAGIVIISINTGAYMSEIVRSGIQSVDKGQMEGARSVGMSHLQTMFYIIIPQAIRNSFPSIINEFIVNIKDSSVLNVIAVNDLYFQGSSVAGSVFKYTETFFVVAMIYLCLTYPTSKILGFIEKRMANTSGKVGA